MPCDVFILASEARLLLMLKENKGQTGMFKKVNTDLLLKLSFSSSVHLLWFQMATVLKITSCLSAWTTPVRKAPFTWQSLASLRYIEDVSLLFPPLSITSFKSLELSLPLVSAVRSLGIQTFIQIAIKIKKPHQMDSKWSFFYY